jgi:uroporphyrinogen decarboxylase
MDELSSRERLLTTLANQKPDRLPCQVHCWMPYYLQTYLGGIDQFEAYEHFDIDAVIYSSPPSIFEEKDLANWVTEQRELKPHDDGRRWIEIITTPDGQLTVENASNQYTVWTTKYIIESESDFEIFNKYVPVPTAIDWRAVIECRNKIGDKGIVRGRYYDFGQCSPWQSFCTLFGTEQAILASIDKPDWVHYVLDSLLQKKLRAIECGGKCELDLIETGGGAGSSNVISPTLHQEFCLPYDQKQHEALHAVGAKVVYHLCGAVMPLLEMVAENGADGLETMTPSSMGGDCDLAVATKRVGERLFFVGAIDQNQVFERGTPESVRKKVHDLHKACPNGGYICSPSDHFFFGDPDNVQAFADAVKECVY